MQEIEKKRAAGRLSVAYVMALTGQYLRRFPFDALDMLLITAVANFNLMAEGGALAQGRIGEADPPRVGISRNALSRQLDVPLETVRRRVAALIEKKVLAEQHDGLVFAPDNMVGMDNNADIAAYNLDLLRGLYRSLRGLGVELD